MAVELKYVTKINEGYRFQGVGGLVIRLIHPDVNGSDQLGMGIVYVNPGEELPPHKHFNEEGYFIISGEGFMNIDGTDIKLEKNMAVYMPAGSTHYTKNTGNEPLIFVCALTPAPIAK
ncbi:MAG: dimethylsulfonioproprionate lyase family protein [Peptococcales bacterium]|jgi:mannose-6-phosphate isomerase-like protein (cupin superfamily)